MKKNSLINIIAILVLTTGCTMEMKRKPEDAGELGKALYEISEKKTGDRLAEISNMIRSQFLGGYLYGKRGGPARTFTSDDVNIAIFDCENNNKKCLVKIDVRKEYPIKPMFVIGATPNTACSDKEKAHIQSLVTLKQEVNGYSTDPNKKGYQHKTFNTSPMFDAQYIDSNISLSPGMLSRVSFSTDGPENVICLNSVIRRSEYDAPRTGVDNIAVFEISVKLKE